MPYLGGVDRDLQSTYGALVAGVMGAAFKPPPPATPPLPAEPIRVGVVSGFFRQHSNWRIPIKGWLEGLKTAGFELFAYYTDGRIDAATDLARSLVRRFVQGPKSIDSWIAEIARDRPHVLIYPEIGMDVVTAQLAGLRIARVQCASWGHPVTTGYPTIDYFLSSAAMEPEKGDEHYTERLACLPGLSVTCEPASRPSSQLTREQLGLDPGRVVYWCGQSLPKYQPRHDRVFVSIACAVPAAQFVFIAFPGPRRLTQIFEQRLARNFAAAGLDHRQYCHFLDRLEPAQFAAAMGLADIYLDSIGWSGCNSTLEALAHDLPIVTMRGLLMRGRHSAAMLDVMGLGARVVDDVAGYVELAARLGTDKAARREMSAAIVAAKAVLFDDRSCIDGLAAFLRQAVVC